MLLGELVQGPGRGSPGYQPGRGSGTAGDQEMRVRQPFSHAGDQRQNRQAFPDAGGVKPYQVTDRAGLGGVAGRALVRRRSRLHGQQQRRPGG